MEESILAGLLLRPVHGRCLQDREVEAAGEQARLQVWSSGRAHVARLQLFDSCRWLQEAWRAGKHGHIRSLGGEKHLPPVRSREQDKEFQDRGGAVRVLAGPGICSHCPPPQPSLGSPSFSLPALGVIFIKCQFTFRLVVAIPVRSFFSLSCVDHNYPN